ncbi:hypothetical protein G6F43_003316 [Rhizopus delemar]|nr:hypothetical protein G6F43_003316 [Rhizopus delemar]
MMNNFIPTFLLSNQHYILPPHHSSLSQQDEDNIDYPTRPQNPMASILDRLDIESNTLVDQDNSNAAIQLKTSNSGFFLGEFVLAHDTILAWAQAHNRRDARLIRIQSTSADHTKNFSPTRGVVSLVESCGISIVSDIDDTIKDTRILAGARKVLSKTFFEQPKDVKGMADVYMTWYNQGASFHYVSNSPFQLMPMLDQFIRDAHFPPGSMHLRDDLSLLSRLVEIPGQAKREAILDIIRDFPQRRFILIGDSGEIDLEIYTKIAFEYPKQVLKIFIRDVTTPLAEEQERKKMHKRMSQSSFLPTFSRRESLVDDDDLFTLQSQHSTPSSSHNKKFQSPLGLRKAVRSTLMEYAVQPHLTGHRTDFHMEGDDDIGLINPHRHHQISTAEACKRLYERVEKARLQIPNVDIVLFQDAQILQNDKYIQDALWNMKGVTDDTLSYRFFK